MLCFACGNYNIFLTCHIYTHMHIRTHTHTHTETHARTHARTHTDLNFMILWKNHEIKSRAIETMLVRELNTRKLMLFLMKA